MKLLLVTFAVAVFLCACGSTTASDNAKVKANIDSASPSPASSPVERDKGADLAPITVSAGEFLRYYDEENEGRIVTVTGGQLEEISYSSLRIRDGGGYAFTCNGSFSEYMSMKTTIDDLRYKNRSPTATVKGVYAKATYDNKATLNSCVLTDIQK